MVRKRKARRKAIGTRAPILIEAQANARWSLDCVHDQFACGRRFRILKVVDDVTRECPAAIPDTSISGRCGARDLTALIERRGKPGMIVSDNGTELNSNAILCWCTEHRIEWHYIAPALLQKSGSGRTRPFPRWVQAMRSISAVASALKRFMSATRIWTSAVWRSGSREAMRSPNALRHRIFASTRLRT